MSLVGTGYVGIGKETTFGTAAQVTEFLPVESVEATTDPQNYYPEQIKGTRSKSQGIPMGRTHEASLAQDADPATLGHWLLAALGKVTSAAGTQAGTFDHTFTPENKLPSFTIEKYDGVMTQQIVGAKCDSMTLSMEAGSDGVLKVEADWAAKTIQDKASQSTPAYTDKAPFVFYRGSVEKGGVSTEDIRTLEIEIANNLKTDGHTISSSRDVANITEGMREVTFSFEMEFKNKQEYLDFMDGKDDSLKITLSGAAGSNDKLIIELPKIMYDGYEVPMGGADDEVIASIEGTAIYDDTAGAEIKATLTNEIASY